MFEIRGIVLSRRSSKTPTLFPEDLVIKQPTNSLKYQGATEKESEALLSGPRTLKFWTSALVVLPVLLQAPWVRLSPYSACLFSLVILGIGIYLAQINQERFSNLGSLLVGVSGSWLGGCLFWGWFRSQPILHLPIEALALPIAIWGINTKWKLGSSFYLSCLLGTAFTDLSIVLTGVMKKWPEVINATISQAPQILTETADELLNVQSLLLLLAVGGLIIVLSSLMERQASLDKVNESSWFVASAALKTTLWIDGLFLLTALLQPSLSGLI